MQVNLTKGFVWVTPFVTLGQAKAVQGGISVFLKRTPAYSYVGLLRMQILRI